MCFSFQGVQFDDTIFHPLINPKTNVTDLSRYFPSGWQRDRNHIYQILTAVQSMFFRCKIDPAQALNAEAAILISQDLNKFKQMARDAVRWSSKSLDSEKFSIKVYFGGRRILLLLISISTFYCCLIIFFSTGISSRRSRTQIYDVVNTDDKGAIRLVTILFFWKVILV